MRDGWGICYPTLRIEWAAYLFLCLAANRLPCFVEFYVSTANGHALN